MTKDLTYIAYGRRPKFSAVTQATLEMADVIIRNYADQGYVLTLRQLYYQFVAQGLIENTEASYKRLGSIVNDGRMAGLLPWDGIEDRTRSVNDWLIQEDERATLDGIERHLSLDMWRRQGRYIEVWVEKEALGNVVERPCSRWRVPYLACKGYLSASEAWRASQRFDAAVSRGQQPLLIHLGDHDPSGIDMTRDNDDRMAGFLSGRIVEVRRIALNMNQVEAFSPPPNPTKVTDSRASSYIDRFGSTSWELDALAPVTIDWMVEQEIERHIDQELWREDQAAEDAQRVNLAKLHRHWPSVVEHLRGLA